DKQPVRPGDAVVLLALRRAGDKADRARRSRGEISSAAGAVLGGAVACDALERTVVQGPAAQAKRGREQAAHDQRDPGRPSNRMPLRRPSVSGPRATLPSTVLPGETLSGPDGCHVTAGGLRFPNAP